MLRVTGQGVFVRCYTLDLDQRIEAKEERLRDVAVNWSAAREGIAARWAARGRFFMSTWPGKLWPTRP
jgi:hypothetical protein